MKHVIFIFGASGSGTTTLGRALSEAMRLRHMDTDDYFWLPTDPKYTAKRPAAERLALMQTDIGAADGGRGHLRLPGGLGRSADPPIHAGNPHRHPHRGAP